METPNIIKSMMMVKVPTDSGVAKDSAVGHATIEPVSRLARMETATPKERMNSPRGNTAAR